VLRDTAAVLVVLLLAVLGAWYCLGWHDVWAGSTGWCAAAARQHACRLSGGHARHEYQHQHHACGGASHLQHRAHVRQHPADVLKAHGRSICGGRPLLTLLTLWVAGHVGDGLLCVQRAPDILLAAAKKVNRGGVAARVACCRLQSMACGMFSRATC
jgi:hypothetical protein